MDKVPLKVDSVEKMKDVQFLGTYFNDTVAVDIQTIHTGGFSSARFSKLKLSADSDQIKHLILKEVHLHNDYFSRRTQDTMGREGALLIDSAYKQIHHIYDLPYYMVAITPSHVGLLMHDVSGGLFPDERKPLSLSDQDLMLDKLAEMHAYFWNDPQLKNTSYLHDMADFLYIMGPLDHSDKKKRYYEGIEESIVKGWKTALPLLPESLLKVIKDPPDILCEPWEELPMTLLHGDTKVANFAKTEEGQLHLFDWAFAGYAPCTFDVGWFLAVNASRLAESKESVLSKYRSFLETHLGYALEDELWHKLKEAGLVCGAFMLLWSKALAVKQGRNGSKKEWDWWIKQLEKWAFNKPS